jgi:hypothetical protein
VAVGLVDRRGGLAEVMEVAELMRHALEGPGHRVADRGLAVGDDPGDRHLQGALDLGEQLGQVALGRGEQAPGQEHLAGDHVADDPEDLVTDIGLEAVDGQDDPAGLGGDPT